MKTLTSTGVGFYSNMVVMVFGDTLNNVDEVISPRFFILSITTDHWTTLQREKAQSPKRIKANQLIIIISMKTKQLFLLILMSIMSVSAFAEDAVINGIKYSLNNETLQAKVIRNYDNKYSGNITIPETVDYNGKTYSLTSIGSSAFFNCTGLTSVTIPNSVIIIRNNAFSGCSALTSITIPNSIEYIGESAFAGCSALTSITVEKGNLAYNSRENCNAVIDSETNELILGCKNTVIPNSVTSIGNYAFYGCYGLTSVTIGNSVTSIGNNAFSGCSGLTSVTIPNSVTSIGDEAFANCLGLKSITLGNSVMSIGNWAFDNCLELTTVISMIEEPFEINDTFLIPYEGEYDEPEVYIPKTLYVPKGTKKIYKRTKGWNVFHNIVESK